MSLRQVYYRFVARNVIVNDHKSYKVLGRLISKARMAGLIDWSAIRDRGRILNTLPHWETTGEIVDSAAGQYRVDLWQDQPTRVEVWTEKDAAIAVIDDLCRRYDVPYLACRGNSSTTRRVRGGDALPALPRAGPALRRPVRRRSRCRRRADERRSMIVG